MTPYELFAAQNQTMMRLMKDHLKRKRKVGQEVKVSDKPGFLENLVEDNENNHDDETGNEMQRSTEEDVA